MNKELLRTLPRVDELVKECRDYLQKNQKRDCESISLSFLTSDSVLTSKVRERIDRLREDVLSGTISSENDAWDRELLIKEICESYRQAQSPNLRRVINGTGITLHTNLGRAPLSDEAAKHVYDIARGYCNLEYDLEEGERGSRYSHVEKLICELTGTESAIAVNNNASAVMLTLHALGYGKNMVISRGEMVEIGGSFRIPEVMQISGVTLKEVGCTNKTRLSDYRDAIDESTAAILKVHTSNYVIMGFTESVTISSLKNDSEISKHDIPVIYDMGSGDLAALADLAGLTGSADSVFADIICFSGDKLLGGPQAGIICGKKKYLDIIKKDNLLRALRIDKLSVAALESTLIEYRRNEGADLPVKRMLGMTKEELDLKYERFIGLLRDEMGERGPLRIHKIDTETETGGGSKPTEKLPDVCLGIEIEDYSAENLSVALRNNPEMPIIGRIHEDMYMLSLRTIAEDEMEITVRAIKALM